MPTAGGVPGIPGAGEPAGPGTAGRCRVAGLLAPPRAVAGVADGDGAPAGATVAGAGCATVAVPAPYIDVPVSWTTPGLSAMPRTVTTWPTVSVSRTVNGPVPAPDDATQ
jgi:hypothetical protein